MYVSAFAKDLTTIKYIKIQCIYFLSVKAPSFRTKSLDKYNKFKFTSASFYHTLAAQG